MTKYIPLTPTSPSDLIVLTRQKCIYISIALNVILGMIFLTHPNTTGGNLDPVVMTNSVQQCQEKSRIDKVKEFHSSFAKMKTAKTFGHGYQFFYGPSLAPYKNKPGLRILEIGAQNGHSAVGWTQYFDDAFVDMMTYGGNDDKIKFDSEQCDLGDCSKIHIFYGDQSDEDMLDKMIGERPDGWDIIVDGASHVPEHNIITFERLWKNVNPGGLYVVEDIQTSYWPEGEIYGYPINAGILAPPPHNALNRFRQYVDIINRGYWGEQNQEFSYFEGDHDIEEIGFSRNIIFVRKALSDNDVDVTGHRYSSYPENPTGAIYHADNIAKTLESAYRVFMEQSEALNPWRTAPSRAQQN